MQKNTPITAKWSISKPKVEFQYGGRLFFQYETGSSSEQRAAAAMLHNRYDVILLPGVVRFRRNSAA